MNNSVQSLFLRNFTTKKIKMSSATEVEITLVTEGTPVYLILTFTLPERERERERERKRGRQVLDPGFI